MSRGRNTTVVGVRLPDDVVNRLKVLAREHQVSLSDLLRPIIGTFADSGHLSSMNSAVEHHPGNEPSFETVDVAMGLNRSTILANSYDYSNVSVEHTVNNKPEFSEHRRKVNRSERKRLKSDHAE